MPTLGCVKLFWALRYISPLIFRDNQTIQSLFVLSATIVIAIFGHSTAALYKLPQPHRSKQ